MSSGPVANHELLDDGYAPLACDTLVIGCGNILRCDDAVGPILIRRLWEQGVPDGVRLVDGGTAGMDVAFQMRGAKRVVIIDASSTGVEPGTIYQVPGSEIEDVPELTGLHTHSFRWDHAIAFSRWLLGPDCPTDVVVYLIEAANLTPGESLSDVVRESMEKVAVLIRDDYFPAVREPEVEITAEGYLRLTAEMAARFFPADVCGAVLEGDELFLIPLQSQANGGHVLKQRSSAGDRCMLVREVLHDELPVGHHVATWNEERGALAVQITDPRQKALGGAS
ncbi:hydrogenase maturation protease [Aeromicrobium sp.]|uniref:hydrogenase maturation protease n=1 Tax=Aeromicrobium sp. TaxID=1871063 RepID=UPI0019B2DB2F|nr:hydrogenase maturation protease [Aeromicrobium sp.]MBC7631844.1 hydrogenase maturation protease [Aeromicrobium sp.]